MSQGSRIEWTDATWNPVTGCSAVSAGCLNCYAERGTARLDDLRSPRYQGLTTRKHGAPAWTGEVRCHPDLVDWPLGLAKAQSIFVGSMADIFHEKVPDAFLDALFGTMAVASRHRYIVLTKRADRMREWFTKRAGTASFPLRNVWLGVSVETQSNAELRMPDLLGCPAAVHFASAEPLLGPLDLTEWSQPQCVPKRTHPLDWVIIGGETGLNARTCREGWIASLLADCHAANVAAFVKQLGPKLGRQYGDGGKKGDKLETWPDWLQVREYPEAAL